MNRRPAYTLIELLVATASASVLMVGLSSALYVSSRALGIDEGAIAARNKADLALSRLMEDVREARSVLQLTPNVVEVRVPDRDADGAEETILYEWSGVSGDPLLRSLNGGTAYEAVLDVRALNFSTLRQTLPALDVTLAPPPPWPVIEAVSSVKVDSAGNHLTLPAPAGIAAGEALFACVVIHNVDTGSVIPPSGWIELDLNEDANHVTFGLWWKLATASEPADYSWRWTGDEKSTAAGLRISNQYAGNPITAISRQDGKSKNPECPSATTTLDNSLVLRIGGFHDDEIDTVGETGLSGHTDVYMDQVEKAGIGVGSQVVTAAGSASGSASFVLEKSKEYRTLTVVVAPEQ